jgi:hypothetical protein
MRRTNKRTRRRGGALGNFGSAVFSGIRQGIKNAPKEIYSTLRSSGSSYLTPTGSIANYAGNNIQNIIKSHNESFRRDMGNKMNTLRTTIKNKNKKPIGAVKYGPIMPYYQQQKFRLGPDFKKYNSKLIYNNKYNNKSYPNSVSLSNKNRVFYNNKNLPIISNMKINNKSKQQQLI